MDIDRLLSSLNPSVHLFFFDMDGVLCDSEFINVKAYQRAAQDIYRRYYDVDPVLDARLFRQCVTGKTYAIAFSAVVQALPELERHATEFEQLTLEYFQALRAERSGDFLIQSSVAFLSDLLEREYRIAIVSGSARRDIHYLLRLMRFQDMNVLIVGDEDYSRGKPHPEPYLTAARRFGVPPGPHCIVIEDSVSGVIAGKQAGMRVIQLLENANHFQTQSPEADWMLTSLDRLKLSA